MAPLGEVISHAALLDFALRPLRCPFDSAPPYPIMRLAREAPIADRRIQRDGAPFLGKLPAARVQGRYDLISAAATTQMRSCFVFSRDIQDTALQCARNE